MEYKTSLKDTKLEQERKKSLNMLVSRISICSGYFNVFAGTKAQSGKFQNKKTKTKASCSFGSGRR